MEYFGRNPFLMNILQAMPPRKLLIAGYFHPGNGGYPPPPAKRNLPAKFRSTSGEEVYA
jgi:hypothetical protein